MQKNAFNADMQLRFEIVYSKYPKKMGKSQGFKTALTQCNSPDLLDQLEIAINNYVNHIAREGTEKQYIMYFSTFMSQWRDWLDPETGSVVEPKLNLEGLGFER